MMQYLVHLIGYVAVVLSFVIFQMKNRKSILFLKWCDDVLWFIHLYVLSGITGAYVTGIAVFRELVFYNKDKKWAKSKIWLILFTLCFVVIGTVTWDGIYSIFPVVNSTLQTAAFWSNNTKMGKMFVVPGALGMIVYGIRYNSFSTVLAQIVMIASIVIFFAREKYKQEAIEKTHT